MYPFVRSASESTPPHTVSQLYANSTAFNWPQGLISKNLQFQLEFHTKDYLLQILFDQHENAKCVKLNGFQNGL